MSTIVTPMSSPFTIPPIIIHAKQRRISVDEYRRMGDLGLLKPDDASS